MACECFYGICIFFDSDFKTEYSAQADACSKLLIETQDKSADCCPDCVQIQNRYLLVQR